MPFTLRCLSLQQEFRVYYIVEIVEILTHSCQFLVRQFHMSFLPEPSRLNFNDCTNL